LRLSFLSVCCAAAAAAVVVSVAHAMHAPAAPARIRAIRSSVDHYRSVAWLFQRAAKAHPTPTSYSYRKSTDPGYLQWTLKEWQQREYDARLHALAALRQRLHLQLPASPGIHASLGRRIAYARTLAIKLQNLSTGHATATRTLASAAKDTPPTQKLYKWQVKAATMTLQLSRRPVSRLTLIGPRWLTDAFTCIHHYEGAWNANSGNGYYGGLQMNSGFMSTYGDDYVRRWGTADHWPAWAQIGVAVRAYRSGRGFWPWPNTARACGLL
jgi:hypothetical protein